MAVISARAALQALREGNRRFVSELGLDAAQNRFQELIDAATSRVPACPGASELRAAILNVTRQLLLGRRARSAA